MLRRGLALCLLLGMASVVQAGAVVTLVPAASGPYAQNEEVFIDVFLTQEAGGEDRYLRYAQLDFNASDMRPQVFMPIAHDRTGPPDIRFWNFLGTPDCPAVDNSNCGREHYIEDDYQSARSRVISRGGANLSASSEPAARMLVSFFSRVTLTSRSESRVLSPRIIPS